MWQGTSGPDGSSYDGEWRPTSGTVVVAQACEWPVYEGGWAHNEFDGRGVHLP